MSQPTAPQFTDVKSAKAQAKAEKAYAKASRPFYKKKRFILLAVIAIIVIIVIASNSGGGSSSSSSSGGGSSSGTKTVGLNQAARDGKFEFTVKGVDCSKKTIGNEPISTTANGVFCIVSLDVKNIGDQA